MCRDMPKFGGLGYLKQACSLRVCLEKEKERAQEKVVAVAPPAPAADKENSAGAAPGSPHVRSLLFSPPTPQKSILKTLTPEKNSSPIKRTSRAWNKEVQEMLTPQGGIQSAIPFTEEVTT